MIVQTWRSWTSTCPASPPAGSQARASMPQGSLSRMCTESRMTLQELARTGTAISAPRGIGHRQPVTRMTSAATEHRPSRVRPRGDV